MNEWGTKLGSIETEDAEVTVILLDDCIIIGSTSGPKNFVQSIPIPAGSLAMFITFLMVAYDQIGNNERNTDN